MIEKNPWKILSIKEIYDNPWLKLRENRVLNPSGNKGIYSIVHFKNIAVGIIPLDENYITWIVGQYRLPLNSYEWEIPEGGSPEGESTLETAKRELLEETGLSAEKWIPILEMQLSNSTTDEIAITYIAKDLTIGNAFPDEDEMIKVIKLPFVELHQMVLDGEIRDAISVASVLKAWHLIKEGKI